MGRVCVCVHVYVYVFIYLFGSLMPAKACISDLWACTYGYVYVLLLHIYCICICRSGTHHLIGKASCSLRETANNRYHK